MNMKHYIFGAMAAGLLLAASCTDFDDYNTANTEIAPEASSTLWENISGNANLTQFAELLKKAGYDKELTNSRFYTVWAPENGTFDYEALLGQSTDVLLQRFVQSHVANFNYTLNIDTTVKVHALNDKSFELIRNAAGTTYDGCPITSFNQPSMNGVLHTISGKAVYLPNLHEYLAEAEDIDSVRSFYKNPLRDTKTIDKKRSVEGPIDSLGRQTYSDTVYVESNTLWGSSYLRADLHNEDSTFTMVVPNNKAFNEAFARIKKCYNYTPTLSYNFIDPKNVNAAITTSTRTVDELLQKDSMVYRQMYLYSVFNNNEPYNRWVKNPDAPNKAEVYDTVYTTQRRYLSNGEEIINKYLATDPVKMSNGWMHIVDSLAMHPWETYNPEVRVGIFGGSSWMPRVTAAVTSRQPVLETEMRRDITDDELLTEFNFLDVTPAADNSNPELFFYVNGLRSTAYNVYIVTVPPRYSRTDTTSIPKQYIFDVSLNYANNKGAATAAASSYKFKPESGSHFMTDSLMIDTVFLGKVDIPVCYYGVNAYPYINIKSARSTWKKQDWLTQDNHLRIAAIIFRPVDYDEYLHAYKAEATKNDNDNEE